jgi:hypothetical protein
LQVASALALDLS